MAREAVALGVDEILAVSDAERSSIQSVSVASGRSWAEEDLSRFAAAQLIVGGAIPPWVRTADVRTNLPKDFSQGFCPRKPLSPGAHRAVGIWRAAAVATNWFLNWATSTDALLHQEMNDDPAYGSARRRLATLYNDWTLASTPDLPAHFGLTLEDFDEARGYLIDEIKAFARDPSATMKPIPGQNSSTYLPYTALRVASRDAPDAFYVALAVGIGEQQFVSAQGDVIAPQSLAASLEYSRRLGRNLGTWAKNNALGFASDQVPRAIHVGGAIHDGAIAGVEGRLTLYVSSTQVPTQSGVYALWAGYTDTGAAEHWLILGEKALRCAIDGQSEGTACADSDVSTARVAKLDTPPTVTNDQSTCELMSNCLTTPPNTAYPTGNLVNNRLYLVRQKVPGNSTPGGFVLEAAADVRGTIGEIPGFSSLYADAAKIIRPGSQWCNHPRLSCADADFDGRLPLEDELAGDADGVESSWKHYLALAKQAAQESDELGSAYVSAGLEVDKNISEASIREEQQRQQLNRVFETIQNTCGTTVDPQRFVDLVKGKPGAACSTNPDCVGAGLVCTSGTCKEGYRTCSNDSACGESGNCSNGICIPDLNYLAADSNLKDDLEVQRLVKCVSSKVYDFVAIGDKALCVSGRSGSAYCKDGSTPSNPCPRLTDEDKKCPGPGEAFVHHDKNVDGSKNTEVLGMFHVRGESDTDPNAVCDAIGTIRSSADQAAREAALAKIVNSTVFLPQNVIDTAKRIGFEARIGSYAAITLDTNTVFHTGALSVGPNYGQWPCAAKDVPGSGPGETGPLWSTTRANCDDEFQRAGFNDRMMRAALLARYLGAEHLGDKNWGGPLIDSNNFKLPAWNFSVEPKASASGARQIRDADGTYANIVEADIKLDERTAKSYVTQDTLGLNVNAYVTKLEGQFRPVWIQGKLTYPKHETPVDAWFALGPFNGPLQISEDSHYRSNFLMQVGNNAYTSVEYWYSPLYSYDAANRRIGYNAVWWDARYNPSKAEVVERITPDRWFVGLSRAIETAPTNSQADAWLSKQLQNLVYGRPLVDLPTHLLHWQDPGAIPLYDPVQFTGDGLLDAMEVLCRVRVAATSGIKPNLNTVPVVSTPADLALVKAYMDEAASRIEDWAARFVLPRFPVLATDFLRQESNSGVIPALGGTYGTTMTTLRASLVELSQVSPLVAFELRQLGTAVVQARIATVKADLSGQMGELNYTAQMANNAAACASSMVGSEAKLSFGATSAVACANSIVQGIIAAKQLAITKEDSDLTKSAALNSFQEQLNTHAEALQSLTARVSKALEEIDGTIADLERQRLGARNALAEAIRVASFTPSAAANVSSALVRKRETERVRYVMAFKNARRMAYLAKRAIEQRLGIYLAELTNDLPLVDAPSSWEGTVCDRSGINYDAVRSTAADAPKEYADAFIGEYVSRLERVVESYRLKYSFHEGTDTAIISLRDDVLNVKAPCSVSVNNLLKHTSDLDAPAASDGTNGWRATGCIPRYDNLQNALPPNNCMSAMPIDALKGYAGFVWKVGDGLGSFGNQRAYNLVSGKASGGTCTSGECDFQPGAAWAQRITLSPGTYRLSYYVSYAGQNTERSGIAYVTASMLDRATGLPLPLVWNDHYISGSFLQRWAIVRLTKTQDLEVQFRTDPTNMGGVFAAPMLEVILPTTEQLQDYWLFPPTTVTTTGEGTQSLNNCEDTTGAVFRTEAWSLGEVPLCPDGFAGDCDASRAQIHKFWQIPFSINQRDIEAGRILNKSGFARGNFNYRIESVALNFVGSGVRNCGSSTSPSTCYSAGFVPYSLDHLGPYMVRNHFGGDFEAQLFTGHIEHARGLAAERYITNPISSADAQLLSDYQRGELQGRPLDGNFVIRLWEEPGVYFDGVEDIQVILKYRYWTRFD